MGGPEILEAGAAQTTSFYRNGFADPTAMVQRLRSSTVMAFSHLTCVTGLRNGTPKHKASYGVGELVDGH
jgi:hypothetical protein